MAKREVIESHVDVLLKRITGEASLERDSDGDWPFPLKRALMYVRVQGQVNPTVRVWAIGAHDVPSGANLYAMLNEVNRSLEFCRALWDDGTLLFATELVGDSLDIEELGTALQRVASAADEFGPKVIEDCGGETLFVEAPVEVSAGREAPGMYL